MKDQFLKDEVKRGYLSRDWNNAPVILYCSKCAIEGKKELAEFIINGHSVCINCFFESPYEKI